MNRTRLAAWAAIATGALVLGGCAPGGSAPTDVQEEDKLVLWYLNSADEVVQAAVARFVADNPDIEVEAVPYANDEFKTRFQIGFGTESGPDLFHTWGGGEFSTYVDAGQVADLTGWVAETGVDQVIGEGALGAGQVNGVQYAIPVVFDASMTWYNTEIFAELGLEPPATWEEFIELIGATRDAGYVPIAMANSTQWPGSHWWSEIVALACGPEMIPNLAAGVEGADFTDPCFVEVGERIQELVNAGAFNDGFNGLDYDSGESRQLFWSEAAAMNHMGGWTISSAKEEAPEMLEKMDFFLLPPWEGAEGTADMLTGGIGMAWGVAENSRNSEAALELLTYLTDLESQQVAADIGRNPVMQGVTIPDPLVARISEALSETPAISLWPDQFLDPQVSQAMLVEVQTLFGLETTPEESAARLQAVLEQVR